MVLIMNIPGIDIWIHIVAKKILVQKNNLIYQKKGKKAERIKVIDLLIFF